MKLVGSIAWWRALARILDSLTRLHQKVDQYMTTEADLSAKLDKIAADAAAAVTATQAALTDLKTQIATLQAGQPVSQTQLDDLSAKADAIDASLQPLLPAPSGT